MRRGLIALLTLMLLAQPAIALDRREANLERFTNWARTSRGIPALQLGWLLQKQARQQARRMAVAGRVFHGLYPHRDWRSCEGQNVGVQFTTWAAHDAFMHSLIHRANILNRCFRWAGYGVVRRDGFVWVVVNFGG